MSEYVHKTDDLPGNAVTEKSPMSEPEFRQAVDYRVMVKLAERDYIRHEYQRGMWDAIYLIGILACIAYYCYLFWKRDE